MTRRIFGIGSILGILIGFCAGMTIGVYLQHKADAHMVMLANNRGVEEMEAVVGGFENVLADLQRFYQRTTLIASWYGRPFHGRLRADGKRFDMHKNTVAHRTLPLGTVILMENLDNGNMSLGTVRDRGPYISPRALDVSYAIAQELGMVEQGLATVRIMVLWIPGGAK